MRVRRLDENGDLAFGGGAADYLVDSPAAVAQVVGSRLRLWRGEWFLDQTEGMPWAQAVLGTGTRELIEPAIRAHILATAVVTPSGTMLLVTGITAFSLVIEDRHARFTATLETVFGPAALEETL